jgi:hypothetical protein
MEQDRARNGVVAEHRFETVLARDRAVRRVVWLARFLDNAIELPIVKKRIGADALIGLVPGVGDVATTLISFYIIYQGRKLGASGTTVAKMVGNVGLDMILGAVPGIGDLGDFFFKSNTRNLALLGKELGIPEFIRAGLELDASSIATTSASTPSPSTTSAPSPATHGGGTEVVPGGSDEPPRKQVVNTAGGA